MPRPSNGRDHLWITLAGEVADADGTRCETFGFGGHPSAALSALRCGVAPAGTVVIEGGGDFPDEPADSHEPNFNREAAPHVSGSDRPQGDRPHGGGGDRGRGGRPGGGGGGGRGRGGPGGGRHWHPQNSPTNAD